MISLEQDICQAVAVIRRGGVIVYPTDTVWGIGCDACNPEAVRRIFEIKRRSDSKALITLVADVADVARYTAAGVDTVRSLMAVSGGRPTTVICPEAKGLAPELTADDGSVGIRVTSEAVSSALCRALGHPLVSTSANISGCPAPAVFGEISGEIISAADYVLEARRDDESRSLPSRIVKLERDGSVSVIRP